MGNLKTQVQLYNSQKLSTQANQPCQSNPQEVLSHANKGGEMENTVGLEDTQQKLRKQPYSDRLWVKKQMKAHYASQSQMLFWNCLQFDSGKHPQKSWQQNRSKLKRLTSSSLHAQLYRGKSIQKKDLNSKFWVSEILHKYHDIQQIRVS